MRHEAMSEWVNSTGTGSLPGVRPFLSMSKGRDDDAEVRTVQESIAPEGAPTDGIGVIRSPRANSSLGRNPRVRRERWPTARRAKSLGPCPNEVRPVLCLSKGRDDGVEVRTVQKSIAPEGAPTVESGRLESDWSAHRKRVKALLPKGKSCPA